MDTEKKDHSRLYLSEWLRFCLDISWVGSKIVAWIECIWITGVRKWDRACWWCRVWCRSSCSSCRLIHLRGRLRNIEICARWGRGRLRITRCYTAQWGNSSRGWGLRGRSRTSTAEGVNRGWCRRIRTSVLAHVQAILSGILGEERWLNIEVKFLALCMQQVFYSKHI